MKNGKYELIVPPRDYPGKLYRERYAYEHHVVWWEKSGHIPPEGFEIHHIDGDHRNNSIHNLCLLTKEAHREVHGPMKPAKYVTLQCTHCDEWFPKEERNYRFKLKQGQVDFYCGRKCMAAAYGNGRPKKDRRSTD